MAREYSNFGDSNSFYYSFPYDHGGSDPGLPYQPQAPAAYFNNCTGYPHQNVGPVRIDMNMTAYVQRPPPLVHQDLFETAQFAVAPGAVLIEPAHRGAFTETRNYPSDEASKHNNRSLTAQQRKLDNSASRVGYHQRPPGQLITKLEQDNSIGTIVLKRVDSAKMTNEDRNSSSTAKNCPRFQCFLCGKKYCRQSTLKAHLRQHSGEKPYVCNICGKNFSQSANLNAHRRVHTGEKPFSCPICCRPFSQSSSLMTHKRTHSGERPYQCSSCDKAFTDSSTLTKHIRTHTGFKPYSCRICHFSFSQSGNLNRHMKTHFKNEEAHQNVNDAYHHQQQQHVVTVGL